MAHEQVAHYYDMTKQGVTQHFGQASVQELEKVVSLQLTHQYELAAPGVELSCGGRLLHREKLHPSPSFAEVLPPPAASLLAGVVHHELSSSRAFKADSAAYANTCATVKALLSGPKGTGTVSGLWINSAPSTFGQRMLQVPEKELRLLADPSGRDVAALRFLAKVLHKNMSMSEVAHALRHEAEGRQCVETFRTSATLGGVVMYASIWSWWDDVWNWLEGAAQWVKDAYNQFGEWAAKQANALVDAVFSKLPQAAKILQEIPGVGLVVAAIYAAQGKSDQAWAALAINLNATVSFIGAAVGFAIGNVPGAMLGGALGKTAGLIIQMALSNCIKDPKLKAEVGDISASRFIADVALSAAGAAAGSIGTVLGTEAGMAAIATLGISQTLATLLGRIPNYFAKPK